MCAVPFAIFAAVQCAMPFKYDVSPITFNDLSVSVDTLCEKSKRERSERKGVGCGKWSTKTHLILLLAHIALSHALTYTCTCVGKHILYQLVKCIRSIELALLKGLELHTSCTENMQYASAVPEREREKEKNKMTIIR